MIVPFQPEHAVQIHRQDGKDFPSVYMEEVREWANQVHSTGPSFTVSDGDTLLACFGMMIIRRGIAEAWMVVSEEMAYEGKGVREMIRGLRNMLPRVMDDLEVHRVGAWVRTDFDRAIRFIEMMGFEREGIMRKYDVDGKDCYLYSIIRESHNGN